MRNATPISEWPLQVNAKFNDWRECERQASRFEHPALSLASLLLDRLQNEQPGLGMGGMSKKNIQDSVPVPDLKR